MVQEEGAGGMHLEAGLVMQPPIKTFRRVLQIWLGIPLGHD